MYLGRVFCRYYGVNHPERHLSDDGRDEWQFRILNTVALFYRAVGIASALLRHWRQEFPYMSQTKLQFPPTPFLSGLLGTYLSMCERWRTELLAFISGSGSLPVDSPDNACIEGGVFVGRPTAA